MNSLSYTLKLQVFRLVLDLTRTNMIYWTRTKSIYSLQKVLKPEPNKMRFAKNIESHRSVTKSHVINQLSELILILEKLCIK